MSKLPLPSHVHYELLLKLLERQTLPESHSQSKIIKDQVQTLIITVRKALAQQRQIETICDQTQVDYEYRWSTEVIDPPSQ